MPIISGSKFKGKEVEVTDPEGTSLVLSPEIKRKAITEFEVISSLGKNMVF
jgi:hypothetical protein